jgi:hypothetical protein
MVYAESLAARRSARAASVAMPPLRRHLRASSRTRLAKPCFCAVAVVLTPEFWLLTS